MSYILGRFSLCVGAKLVDKCSKRLSATWSHGVKYKVMLKFSAFFLVKILENPYIKLNKVYRFSRF